MLEAISREMPIEEAIEGASEGDSRSAEEQQAMLRRVVRKLDAAGMVVPDQFNQEDE